MKQRRHRRKESFSILLVSNTGRNNRHFHVSGFFLWLVIAFVFAACVSLGWLVYRYVSGNKLIFDHIIAGRSTEQSMDQTDFLEQIEAKDELIRKLEEEKDTLSKQNDALTSENKALFEAAKANTGAGGMDRGEQADDLTADPAFPGLYPYSETGSVFEIEKYSDDHPYVSIGLEAEGNVIAAGNGIVSMVGTNDDYPLIMEIEHGNGYKTRYMLLQETEPLQEEGAQVEAGAALFSVDLHNAQLDYQVIYEEQPIDPLNVFEAKG